MPVEGRRSVGLMGKRTGNFWVRAWSANASGGFVWQTDGEEWRAVKGLWEGWGEKQGGLLGAETEMKEGEPISLVRQR